MTPTAFFLTIILINGVASTTLIDGQQACEDRAWELQRAGIDAQCFGVDEQGRVYTRRFSL